MKLGIFLMPSHPPERGLKAGQDWDLEVLRTADRLGYTEALDRRAFYRALGSPTRHPIS